jgi:protein-tyrosine-phosphatase
MWPDLSHSMQKLKTIAKFRVREPLRDLYWGVYGRSLRNPRLDKVPESLLFVCTGNICRSPFAERKAARLLEEEHGRRLVISSAGIHVETSLPSPENAVLAGRDFRVDLVDHRSRRVTEELVDDHDMILCMEAGHTRALWDLFPDHRHKFHLLPLFERPGDGRGSYHLYNIEDPYGHPLDRYRECFRQIERCLQELFRILFVSGSSRVEIRNR